MIITEKKPRCGSHILNGNKLNNFQYSIDNGFLLAEVESGKIEGKNY